MTGPREPFPPSVGPTGTPPIAHTLQADPRPGARARFRRTLVRVVAVQVVALLLLWALQAHFTR